MTHQTLSSLVLFVWCFYDRSGAAPPLEYIKTLSVNRYVEIELETEDSQEKTWNNFMADYGYRYTDELDLVLASYVERGYLDTNALNEQLSDRNIISQRDASLRYHREIWSMYYDSFEDNEELLVKALA